MMAESIAPISAVPASGPVIEEDPRVLAANVVHAIYRLVKGCFLHDDTNQALVPLVESVIDATHQFTSRTGAPHASVLFANNTVFVNHKMLRASRDTYQLALELGGLLAPCNVTEVTVETGVNAVEVAEFGRAIAAMHRDKKANPLVEGGGWAHLRVRKVLGFGGRSMLPPVTRVARTYAASIMIVRGFYADLRKGKHGEAHALKRVAQKISGALPDEKRLLLSTAATPRGDTDRSGIAVSSAIIAVLMASQLSDDRVALTNLAMAALLYDTARMRLARLEGGAIRQLNEQEEELLPTSSVVAMTALGKLHPPSIARSVIVYEALALRSPVTRPYGGARAPHILSRILAVARAFSELRVARGSSLALSMDDAIDVLSGQANDNTSKSLVKLLVGTLGVFPAGTLVELSTGELAVVLSTPRLPIDFARPPVRVMYDENAVLLEEPFDVDLAAPPKGAPPRVVKKPIDASDQQMKQMRAYVMSLAAKKRTPVPAPSASVAPVSPRSHRKKTDPRQDEEKSPPIDVVESNPPRAGRKDSGRGLVSDEEQRSLAEVARATRAARVPQVNRETGSVPPSPQPRVVCASHGAPTRQVDWERDAMLARYISDMPSAPGVDVGRTDSVPPYSAPPSSGSRAPESPRTSERSHDPRRERSSGGLRWSTADHRGDSPHPGGGADTSEPADPALSTDDAPPPPSMPPVSGRAKAGNQSWGTPKRGK